MAKKLVKFVVTDNKGFETLFDEGLIVIDKKLESIKCIEKW